MKDLVSTNQVKSKEEDTYSSHTQAHVHALHSTRRTQLHTPIMNKHIACLCLSSQKRIKKKRKAQNLQTLTKTKREFVRIDVLGPVKHACVWFALSTIWNLGFADDVGFSGRDRDHQDY